MLINAPSGAVNLYTFFGTPFFSKHLIVTGSVPADDAEPQAVIHAGECLSHQLYGFSLVNVKNTIGNTTSRWMNMPATDAPINTPRFCPMSAISSVSRFAKMRKKTPMGASLIKNSMMTKTIRSTSLMARRRDDFSSGPLIKQPTMMAETRTASSSSLATALTTLEGMKDSATWTTMSWAAFPLCSEMVS